jgi:hypothetical protein
LLENGLPTSESFIYLPILDIDAYGTFLKSKGFDVCIAGLYNYPSCDSSPLPDISVAIHNFNDGIGVQINHVLNSNPNLLKAIAPAGVPLVQYQLTKSHENKRDFITNHIAEYKRKLSEMGFEKVEYGINGGEEMRKVVGNCVYLWFNQQIGNNLQPSDRAVNHNWLIYNVNDD